MWNVYSRTRNCAFRYSPLLLLSAVYQRRYQSLTRPAVSSSRSQTRTQLFRRLSQNHLFWWNRVYFSLRVVCITLRFSWAVAINFLVKPTSKILNFAILQNFIWAILLGNELSWFFFNLSNKLLFIIFSAVDIPVEVSLRFDCLAFIFSVCFRLFSSFFYLLILLLRI